MLDQTHAHTDSLVIVCEHLITSFTYRYLQKNSAMDHVDPVALLHGAIMVLFLPGAVWKWPGRGLLEHWTGHGTIGDHWGPMKPAHGLTIPIHPDC